MANKSNPQIGSLLPPNPDNHHIGYVLNPSLFLIHLSSRLHSYPAPSLLILTP
jgi:hypothetical protein